MARRRVAAKPEPEPPTISPQQGQGLLATQIEKAKEVLALRPINDDAYTQWELVTRNIMEKAFGRNSPNVSSIVDVGKYGVFPMEADGEWWDNHNAESLKTQIAKLEGLFQLLQTEVELAQHGAIRPPETIHGHKIFLTWAR